MDYVYYIEGRSDDLGYIPSILSISADLEEHYNSIYRTDTSLKPRQDRKRYANVPQTSQRYSTRI